MFRDVNIELTNVCNFNCLFCPNDIMTRQKGFMKYEVAKDIMDDLWDNKITRLINFYLMGESLLHPEIFKIFDYAFAKGFSIKLNTNASLINDKVAAKLLSYSDLNLFISYHSPHKESFTDYRRSKSIGFEEWNNNIKNLIKKKIKLKSPTQITLLLLKTPRKFSDEIRGNVRLIADNKEARGLIDEWKKFAEISGGKERKAIKEKRKEYKFLPFLIKKTVSKIDRLNYSDSIMPGVTFTVIKIHSWSNSAKDNGQEKFYRAIFGSCEALRETVSVLYNGDYTLCCADYDGELVQGNVTEKPISGFLKSEAALNIINSFKASRLPFDKCKECRGASNLFNWIFNQVHSSVFYNSGIYRKIRDQFFLDTK